MPLHAKICGLRRPEHALLAASHGAAMLGFVHFPASPRHLSTKAAAELAQAVRMAHATPLVAVVVNPSDPEIEAIMSAYRPDYLQLHGAEDAARIAEIKSRFGVKIIKAVAVSDAADMARAASFAPLVEVVMLDAKPPEAATLPGGNGISFDWSLPMHHPLPPGTQWLLSGGLTPENVRLAAAQSGAALVDVSSGVEYQPGEKDPARILAFLQACAHT